MALAGTFGLHENIMAQFIATRVIDTIQGVLHIDHPHIW
jgi:hypothetical protein